MTAEKELRVSIMELVEGLRILKDDQGNTGISHVKGFNEFGVDVSALATTIFNTDIGEGDVEAMAFYAVRITSILDATTVLVKNLVESVADDWNTGGPAIESVSGDYIVSSLYMYINQAGNLLTTMLNQIIFDLFRGLKQLGYKVVLKEPTEDQGFMFFFEGNKSDLELPFNTLDTMEFIEEVVTPLLNFLMEDKDPEVIVED